MPADLSKKAKHREIFLKRAQKNPFLVAQRIRENQTFDLIAQRLEQSAKNSSISEDDRQQLINSIVEEYYRLVDHIDKFYYG
jgi:hypothetical protein